MDSQSTPGRLVVPVTVQENMPSPVDAHSYPRESRLEQVIWSAPGVQSLGAGAPNCSHESRQENGEMPLKGLTIQLRTLTHSFYSSP